MNPPIYVEDERGSRHIEDGDFPLAIGAEGRGVGPSGGDDGPATAWLGVSGGELFVQAGESGSRIVCNGSPVTTSQWLHHGDVVRVGELRIEVRHGDGRIRLVVERQVDDNVTEPPSIQPVSPVGTRADEADGTTISPAEFRPRGQGRSSKKRRGPGLPVLLVATALIGLGAVAWLVFTSRAVRVTVRPEPDRMELTGGLFNFEVGGRYLLRPGRYRLVAEKAGHRLLDVPLEVTDGSNQSFEFELDRLPGLLDIIGLPAGAVVLIDGVEAGIAPLGPFELAPGDHEVRVRSERHLELSTQVSIEGEGARQTLEARPTPRWASISLASEPGGATVRVDGEVVGKTPLTAELFAGRHDLEMVLAGHKPFRRSLSVEADRPQTLPVVRLDADDGTVVVESEPAGAMVSVDGVFRGQTPLELDFRPGQVHEIELSKTGHEDERREIRLESGETKTLGVVLAPRQGEVSVAALPADAELWVDGESRGAADQTLRLSAVPHRIEIRKPGFEPHRSTVTPRPGFPQSVRVELKTPEQIEEEKFPRLVRSPEGDELILIEGGRMRVGSPRREPGRRTNETRRDVELTRRFYLAAMEVSNRQFRRFKDDHRSGRANGFNLAVDHHPVVRVSWEDAARYCNWLSAKESLPAAYVESGGTLVGVRPLNTGYRLPTEAEWAWAARFAEGGPRKYPWGDSLPVAPDSGNYADVSARSLLSATLNGYTDGFPATAPVDSFGPSGLGLLNLGGNVSEWVHDVYTIYPATEEAVDRDPIGPAEGELHVIRGASWMDSNVSELRLAYRDHAKDGRPDVGFRIARYAE